MKKIAIMGARGFVGKALTAHLQDKYTVCPITREQFSLLDEQAVTEFFERENIDVVFHCANQGGSRKTGYDVAAPDVIGNNLKMFFNMERCLKDGMKLICVVMKDENPNYYEDTIALFDYGFSNFQRVNISQTETKYNIENAGSFYSGNDIFGNSKPILELNQTDSITLPNTITFQDAVSSISYDNTEPGQVAVITYTYNDVVLGTASLDFTAAEKGSSVFRENTAETTESAEESGATDETQSGTTTTEAGNTETTETAGDNTGNNGGIPTVAQETSPEEENSTSGGPAVIFINVVKVFFCIVGIAVLIFLALLLRTFFKNYHFAHRSTRLTWRFNRRRNRSRSRYRSVDQDLRNRRKEAIRQAKKRQKPKKSSHFRG